MSKYCILLLCLCVVTYAVEYYNNPIVNADTPDPGVIYVDGVYYVATTTDFNTDVNKFPIRMSTNLVNWTLVDYIFPQGHLPVWGVQDFWAPEIHFVNGQYLAYYVARNTHGVLSVGVAFSSNVTGPYKDIGEPLITNATMGNIDPTFFKDPETGKNYVIWKEDGNGANPPEKYTPIWAVEVTSDGLEIVTDRVEILKNDPSSWEGILVEGPWMIYQYGYYYLFYSANMYATDMYAVGVARASNILGPFEKYENNPILHSNNAFSGPGHCSVISLENDNSPENLVMIYHAWIGNQIGGNYWRELLMDAIVWENGEWPIISNSSPSFTPQPVPQV